MGGSRPGASRCRARLPTISTGPGLAQIAKLERRRGDPRARERRDRLSHHKPAAGQGRPRTTARPRSRPLGHRKPTASCPRRLLQRGSLPLTRRSKAARHTAQPRHRPHTPLPCPDTRSPRKLPRKPKRRDTSRNQCLSLNDPVSPPYVPTAASLTDFMPSSLLARGNPRQESNAIAAVVRQAGTPFMAAIRPAPQICRTFSGAGAISLRSTRFTTSTMARLASAGRPRRSP